MPDNVFHSPLGGASHTDNESHTDFLPIHIPFNRIPRPPAALHQQIVMNTII